MKKLAVILMFFIAGGTLSAYAANPLDKSAFHLNSKDGVDNMNKIIYLEARVKELEKELEVVKNAKTKGVFGLAYIDEEGKLRCKSEDGGKDWDWNGRTWTRQSEFKPVAVPNIENCPIGKP